MSNDDQVTPDVDGTPTEGRETLAEGTATTVATDGTDVPEVTAEAGEEYAGSGSDDAAAADQGASNEASSDQDASDQDSGDQDAGGQPAVADDDDAPKVSSKQAALDEEADIATDYLEELMEIAGLDGEFDLFVEGGRPHVSIDTESDQLVGRNGEVLDALQELCRLAVMTETGVRSRLMLDVAGHRDQRRRELRELATDAIQDVKDTGEPARLSPMNPFERKIVHDAVAEAGLSSESEGEEPRRRVVVLPA